MATATQKCKVCGKEYEYCRTFRKSKIFRWQDVACCPEHGAEYLQKIRESRATNANQNGLEEDKPSTPDKIVGDNVVEDEIFILPEDEDDDDGYYFDDDGEDEEDSDYYEIFE